MPSRSPATPNSTRTWAIPATPTAPTISTARSIPYGVAARKGWMALNFFYNTGIDAHNVIIFDEPWSRPGDYVLLRALTDLVCVSSACPDDIDAANAWNPTDIHVRTYSDKERFSRAIAHRMTPDAEPKLTRETAFHRSFAAHTRDFTEYRGFWLPQKFNNAGADRGILGVPRARRRHGPVAAPEIRGDRARCRGADAIRADPRRAEARRRAGRLFGHVLRARRHARRRHAVPARPRTISAGSAATNTTASGCASSPRRWASPPGCARSTDQLHNIAVQGPKSRDILKDVIWTPPAQPKLAELQWFRFLDRPHRRL